MSQSSTSSPSPFSFSSIFDKPAKSAEISLINPMNDLLKVDRFMDFSKKAAPVKAPTSYSYNGPTTDPRGTGGFMSLSSYAGQDIIPPGQDPTFSQSLGGYSDVNGNQFKGWGGGAFDLAKTVAGGYFQYQQMKQAQEELAFQKKSWMQNYMAQRHAFNQEAMSINAARDSFSSKGHRIEQLPA